MFEIINNTNNDIENITTLNNYINFVVKKLSLEKAIFNIIFVDSTYIHNLNKEYRGVDRVTDVISFALEDNKDFEYQDFRLLGDIYMCVEKMIEQANIYEHPVLREMCFLATHGLLHLLGYDHMEEEDEKVMFSLQEDLLNEYEIKR